MKGIKNLGKRGLSLFLTLVMCLSMAQITVFAADEHTHNADGWTCTQGEPTKTLTCDKHVHTDACYVTEQGELKCTAEVHEHGPECYAEAKPTLNCDVAEHEHGPGCYEPGEEALVCNDTSEDHVHDSACFTQGEDVLVCTQTEHQHGDSCYKAEPELICGKDEHEHGDGCYEVVTVKTCTEEDHEHTDDCYTVTEGEWTCVAPKAEEPKHEEPKPDGSLAGVQAFLDAVDAIEVPEEDLVLEENAELAEAFSGEVFYAAGLFEELTEEEQELEEVQIAMLELQNMLTVLPDYGASTYALSNVVVAPDYNPGLCYPGVSKFGGSIGKAVGEAGFYQRRAVQDFRCTGCGWYYGRSDAKEYANIQWEQSVDGVISDVSFVRGDLQGYPCLQMNFTGAEAGTTLVTIQYDVNFHTRWNSSYAACPACCAMTPVQQYDDNWYHYEDTFYVTVESPKHEDQVWYVYVPTNGIENGSATIELNAVLPKNSIYYYNYGYVWNKYNAFMPVRNVSLSDPNGVRGNYANVTWEYTRHKDWVGAPSYNYGINLTVTGLDTPTPDGKPISVFLNYEWPYSCKLVNANDFYMYYSIQWGNTVSSEIRIVVYEPETVTIKAGEANKYTHNYGDEQTGKSVDRLSYGAKLSTVSEVRNSPNIPKSSNENVVKPSFYPDTDLLDRDGTSAWYWAIGRDEGTAKVSTTYTYFGNYVGSASNYIEVYPRTTYVDVVNYKVIAATTTPVTIVKEFDGLTQDQIPDGFVLNYTIAGCSEHNSGTVTLNKANATVTNANGTPSLVWNVELPAVKHGDATHTITFTESGASAAGFTGPTMTGNTVTLESLTAEDGAKPVIAVTNKYEPDKTMYVLSYDGMGGTGCPATQYTSIGNSTEHTFNVKGAETKIKVPVNPGYRFKGWSETDTNQVLKYTYDSTSKTYSPATITLKKEAPSKTLYAVWEKTTAPINPKLEKLEKARLTAAPAGVTLDLKGKTVNYDQNVVFVGDNAPAVTLLYELTVTGTEGAAYKVTDTGATWVGGDGTPDAEGIITGTIAEGKTTAVIYVTKDFTKNDVTNGKLVNNATLESNGTSDNPTDGPEGDNGKGGDTSDAKKQYNVTVNYKTDGDVKLKESDKTTVDEGGDFNYSMGSESRKARTGADVTAVVIPLRLGENSEYVLDKVASAAGLAKLTAAKNITADVVADIIYSLDVKGTINGDSDTSDGIPDKYQVKVTFQVQNGLWSDGTSADKAIYLEKYAADGTTYAANGTAKLAGSDFPNTSLPLPFDGFKEDGAWTSGGISVVAGDKNITEDTVFVFTYQPKGTMTVTAQGYEGVYDGKWHEPIASLTITDPEGNVIELDDGELTLSYDVKVAGIDDLDEIKDVQEMPIEITVGHKKYETVKVNVVAKITPAPLTVTTNSASKTYDGTPLTAPGSVSGLVNGETVTFTVTGSQTAVGSSSNTYTLTWDGTAKESNYTVTEGTIGTLTVTRSTGGGGGTGGTGGGGGGGGGGTPTPTPTEPDEPVVEIPDEDVPLVDVPDVDVPQTETPEELVEVPEEDVPLADVPKTGDNTGLWRMAALMSAAGLAVLTALERRQRREE